MARIARNVGKTWAAWIAFVSGVVLIYGCNEKPSQIAPPASVPSSTNLAERTVCPQHGRVWIPATLDTAWRSVATLSVPQYNTQIPEFHDCQRLLDPRGEAYGPLAAVYAHPLVVSLLDTLVKWEENHVPKRALAVAEIISDGGYLSLGIEIGVNCLYMYTTNKKPQAFMRPVATEAECGDALNPVPPQPKWTGLNVVPEDESPAFSEDDFPPAARWDWDERTIQKLQFIGVPCGTSWCLIGHPHAKSAKRYDRPSKGRLSRRVARIRGWYDEQILGDSPASGSPGPVHPGAVFGTIFPDSLLGVRTDASFEYADTLWVPAAEILVQGDLPRYKYKFNLDATPLVSSSTPGDIAISNKLSLCKGDTTRCLPTGTPDPCVGAATTSDPWYARITSATKNEVEYRCVIRHLHTGFKIPGTARWWWLENDEGIWTRCPQGCCQVTSK